MPKVVKLSNGKWAIMRHGLFGKEFFSGPEWYRRGSSWFGHCLFDSEKDAQSKWDRFYPSVEGEGTVKSTTIVGGVLLVVSGIWLFGFVLPALFSAKNDVSVFMGGGVLVGLITGALLVFNHKIRERMQKK